jgi:poly-gamma-glutamate synthesis protein (capsule biosynthesis protein)
VRVVRFTIFTVVILVLLSLVAPSRGVVFQEEEVSVLSVTPFEDDTVRILFIGDVMAHKLQLETALIDGGNASNPDDYDFSSYFKYIKPLFDSADFVVANMEYPTGVTPFSGYPIFSAPSSLDMEALNSGIDLFLKANNHLLDKGRAGVDSTRSILRREGIAYTGFYADKEEEYRCNPFIDSIGGICLAIINFTYGLNGFQIPEPYIVNMMDTTQIRELVERAKERGAEFIIATPHWGEEYQLTESATQRRWRDSLYRYGVDAIVGTHPHVVQKCEYDTLHATAYSLGNFVSNMSIAYGQIGMVYELRLKRRPDSTIALLPPKIDYWWCARTNKLERNYTVVPIMEYLDKKEQFKEGQYEKMVREWNAIVKKFGIDTTGKRITYIYD